MTRKYSHQIPHPIFQSIVFVLFLFLNFQGQAQNTFVYFHNNTHLDFNVTTTGNPPPHPDDWDAYNGPITALQPHKQLMRLYRDWGTSDSSQGYYFPTSTITFPNGETVQLEIEYFVEFYDFFNNPFPRISFRLKASGPGFNHPWRNDRTIYDQVFNVGGTDYMLRYQAYETTPQGLYDDILFSIYEMDDTPYTVDAADLSDPTTFNIMSYNVYMRPTSLFPDDDQATRAQYIAGYVHDMDAIIFQEVFDNDTRVTLLNALYPEYPYQTTVVDDNSNALEDGGVLIVSRWPIETEDQLLFGDICNADDCVSNKGIKYARINKMGVKYHVFGTHMDAFNEVDDINTRKQQLVAWKSYIDGKSIPETEAVLMGGDYNIDMHTNKLGEYDSLWGNFSAELPIYTGYPDTWDPVLNHYLQDETDAPEFLDYVLSQSENLNAIYKENESLIMRSNNVGMWRIFDLSDHYAIWGKFKFPKIVYVDEMASGNNDGSSWTDAFTDLQDALALGEDTQIYVAQGTYYPTSTSSRGIYFNIANHVSIFGGYPTGGGTPDPMAYPTILSGDIDGDGTSDGNSFHVIRMQQVEDIILDGIQINDGNADNAQSYARSRGGGIYASQSFFRLNDVSMENNHAIYGGGIFATQCDAINIDHSTISMNTAEFGSAIYHSNSSQLFMRYTKVEDNVSLIRCAIESNNSTYTLIENSIIANNASKNANAIGLIATNRNQSCDINQSTVLGETKNKYLLSLQVGYGDQLDVNIHNSILGHQDINFDKSVVAYNNGILNLSTSHCYIQGSSIIGTTDNNIYSSIAGDLLLQPDYSVDACSPIVNMGNDTHATGIDTDIVGNARLVGIVDIGAYESQMPCNVNREVSHTTSSSIRLYPNPSHDILQIQSDIPVSNVYVYDALGRIWMESDATLLDVRTLPTGQYFVRVQLGQDVEVSSFIKK